MERRVEFHASRAKGETASSRLGEVWEVWVEQRASQIEPSGIEVGGGCGAVRARSGISEIIAHRPPPGVSECVRSDPARPGDRPSLRRESVAPAARTPRRTPTLLALSCECARAFSPGRGEPTARPSRVAAHAPTTCAEMRHDHRLGLHSAAPFYQTHAHGDRPSVSDTSRYITGLMT